MGWSNRNWLITGASIGFGRALTEAILARGGRVIAATRDPGALSALVEGSNGRAIALGLDVTRSADIAAAVREAEAFGGVDVLVNNAGYGFLGGVEESSDAEVRAQFDVNFFGAVALIRAVLPGMRARKAGYVINISSIAGASASPGSGFYSATKFALEGMSEALALEVAPFGIGVLIVEPGSFRTAFLGRSMVLPKNKMPEYEVFAPIRQFIEGYNGAQPGDPVRGAALIVDTLDQPNPPRRLIMGAEAYDVVGGALRGRLAEVEAQRELALTACFPNE